MKTSDEITETIQTVSVKIKGVSPLLMRKDPRSEGHSVDENEVIKSKSKKNDTFTPEKDCEEAVYRNEHGCFAPAHWIRAALREAAKGFKMGRSGNYSKAIVAFVFIEPLEIPLNKKTWDKIIMRPMKMGGIGKVSVWKGRPMFLGWELDFKIRFDSERISKDMVHAILKEAGACKGIGSGLPEYGRFEIIEWNGVS